MIIRRKKMKKDTDELLNAVEEIAEIIHMQMPLRYQDKWLEDIMDSGIWRPEPEEILREQEQ
jgi:hypothetical protein